jgi:hypothetical protein
MAESLEFYQGEPGTCRIAGLRNLLIISWTSRATGPAIARLGEATQRVITSYPAGTSAIHLIADKAGVPTPEARSALMHLMSTHSKSLACVAVVVGGTGFWASTMRSFVTGMRFMTPRNFDLRLHGTIEEVLEWFPKQHEKISGVSIDVATLARALGSVEEWPDEGADLFSRDRDTGT